MKKKILVLCTLLLLSTFFNIYQYREIKKMEEMISHDVDRLIKRVASTLSTHILWEDDPDVVTEAKMKLTLYHFKQVGEILGATYSNTILGIEAATISRELEYILLHSANITTISPEARKELADLISKNIWSEDPNKFFVLPIEISNLLQSSKN
ncbi:MAG: hypothetical protein KGZ96_08580 [Clostridia bacterium]|jgi:hypothetical protein|nr:hypothetical protein [Clostridia bacterium]